MKHIKPSTLGLMKKPYRYRGRNYLVIGALGFFKLGEDNVRFLEDNLQWPKIIPLLPYGQPLDEIMPKSRCEVLLCGSAHAPGGKPVGALQVSLGLGSLTKRLRVSGNREWMNGLLPLYQVSEPKPFTAMPLTYSRAYGGPKHGGNPQGCGYTGNPLSALVGENHGVMPNIEYPDIPIRSAAKTYEPAGFGPIGLDWSPRKQRHGTFDQHWLDHDAPGLAADVDWLAFNRAPADQWLPAPLSGGEDYRLENLHPQRQLIEGRLPTAAARAFVQRSDADGGFDEVAMTLDTVWFFPDQEIGLLIYHGQTAIGDAEAQDIHAVLLAYEHDGAPKSLAHYRQVFELRTNRETAALHAFNESQLAPEHGTKAQALRLAEREAEADAKQLRQQAIHDEIQSDLCAKLDLPLPAKDDIEIPIRVVHLSRREIEVGDFDLSETIADAKAKVAKVRAEGEKKIGELLAQKEELQVKFGAPPDEPADIAQQKNAAFELASVPAYDLLPDAEPLAAIAPRIDAIIAGLKLPAPFDPERIKVLREQFGNALLKTSALRRKGRNAAAKPTAPAQPLDPEAAAWLGRQVQQWLQGGAHLAGRDLAGADLRGFDFSGADLREILLERANLSGATFAGANLAGATFTGATLDGADFTSADLNHANLCLTSALDTRFAEADLSHARANQAQWRRADLRRAVLDDCLAQSIDLSDACLDHAELNSTNLLQACAPRSSWRGAKLDKTVLLKADLRQADFGTAQLKRVTLLDARLQHSLWRHARLDSVVGAKADWSNADLQVMRAEQCGWHGADFSGADLSDAVCLHCNFDSCDFTGATLTRGLFSGSRFMNATLRGAKAADADFYHAMGRKADFTDADLRKASLAQMDLSGALFAGANMKQVRLDPNRRTT